MAAAASPKGWDQIIRRAFPVKTVLLPWRTDDPLRVIQNAVSVAILRSVFHLRLHVTAANVDGDQLVAAHAARQDLYSASRDIEMPLASLGASQRNRQRPIVVAGDNHGAIGIRRLHLDLHFFMRAASEFGACVLVFRGVAGTDNVRTLRAKQLHESGRIVLPAASTKACAASCGVAKRAFGRCLTDEPGSHERSQRQNQSQLFHCSTSYLCLLSAPSATRGSRTRRWRRSLWWRRSLHWRAARRPQAGHSVLGMSVGCRAILHSAERAAILLTHRRAAGNVAIPKPLRGLSRGIPRPFRNRAGRDGLAHIAPVLIAQARIRIGNTRTMLWIMRPDAGAVRTAQIPGIEIVLMNEGVVHNHPAIAPSGMPAPASPSAPAGSEE